MALKIRLARGGAKKRPFYQVVVADARSPRDGRFVEKVGTYNPMLPKDHQDRVRLNLDRIKHWLSVGAQPTDRVSLFLGKENIIPMPAQRVTPIKSAPKAKTVERMKEKEEALKAKEEAAKAPPPEEGIAEPAAEATPEAEAPAEATPEASAEETAPEAPAEEAAPEAATEASAEAAPEETA